MDFAFDNVIVIIILIIITLLIYSKIKNKTLRESFDDFIDIFRKGEE